ADILVSARSRTDLVSDTILNELAADPAMWLPQEANGAFTIPVLPVDRVIPEPAIGDDLLQSEQRSEPAADAAKLVVLGLAAGSMAGGPGLLDVRKRRPGRLFAGRKSIEIPRL